jgi:tetratricopeptide (TPR) repeat protein
MPTSTPLSGDHIQRLQDALLDAYDFDGLRRMVRTQLDEDLERIVAVPGRTLTDIVYDLIRHYAAEAGVLRLLSAARAENPTNPRLAEVAAEFAGIEFDPLPLPGAETNEPVVFDQRGQQVEAQINVAGDYITVEPPVRLPSGRRLLAGAAVLAALGLAGGLLWFLWPQLTDWWTGPACAGTPLCAVVAELAGPDPVQARYLTTGIANRISHLLDKVEPGQAVVAKAARVDSSDAAKCLGAAEDALLVVWGSIKPQEDKLTVSFELVDLLGVGESHDLRTLRAQPLDYDPVSDVCVDCIEITADELSARTAIVAYAASGLLHYGDQPEQAYRDFMAALYCAGEEVDPNLLKRLEPDCTQHERLDNWNPALLHYYAGKSAVLSGDYETGIRLLQEAAGEKDLDPAAPIGIGAAYQAWTDNEKAPEAIAAFDQAIERALSLESAPIDDDNWAPLYHDLGLGYELQKDWIKAAESYRKAVESFRSTTHGAKFDCRYQPGPYVSLIRLGYALEQNGDVDGAEERFAEALQLDAGAPWAYLELANLAWRGRQDRKAAEDWLTQAERVAPDNLSVQLLHADLCADWGDRDCAQRVYGSALALRPDSGWLNVKMGDFYRPTKPVQPGQSWQQAGERYRRAEELRPRDPWVHWRLAYVLFHQGQFQDAIEHYETSIALTYDDSAPADLYCSLAAAQACAGMADEAQASREECERRGGEVKAVSCPPSASSPPTLPP